MAEAKRVCGSCQLCCKMIGVEPLGKPEGKRCKHQAHYGCAIYTEKPECCTRFMCAWLVGMLPKSQKPTRTGVVVWTTVISSTDGTHLEHLQANIATPGASIPPSTYEKLVEWSHRAPVIIKDGETCKLLQDGKIQGKWNDEDFIIADTYRDRVSGLLKLQFKGVRPRSEIIASDADAENWERVQRDAIQVEETKEEYRCAMQPKQSDGK